MEWFYELLKAEVDRRKDALGRNGERVLADEMGVDRTTILRWLNESEPRLSQFERLLSAVGGDIRRALPDYDPTADADERARDHIAALEARVTELERAAKVSMTALAAVLGKNQSAPMEWTAEDFIKAAELGKELTSR